MNCLKIYFYYDYNLPKRGLQIVYYKYTLSFKVLDIIGVKNRQSFKTTQKNSGFRVVNLP